MRNIIVDLDGVTVQYNFAEIIQKDFGHTVINSGIWCCSIEDSLGVSPEAVTKMFQVENKAKPNFMPGAIETLKYFLAKDYEVYILTNRLYFMTKEELVAWLEKYRIPYSGLVTNGDLPFYAHAHIDDSPTKLMSVRDKIEVKHSILFENPWNKKCLNIKGEMERAKNWGQVRRIVNEEI